MSARGAVLVETVFVLVAVVVLDWAVGHVCTNHWVTYPASLALGGIWGWHFWGVVPAVFDRSKPGQRCQ